MADKFSVNVTKHFTRALFILSRVSGVCQGVQGACPRQAVTSAEVTVERSERRDVGTGLKLVTSNCLSICHRWLK